MLNYYDFKQAPFEKTIMAQNLYLTEAHEEAISRLEYTIAGNRFAVLTGDSGSGKSTLLRYIAEKTDKNKFPIYYISDSDLTPRNFYWEILNQMGCTTKKFYRGDAKRQMHKEIWQLVGEKNKIPVIIVDEAHLLSREMLEEIRFLLNFRMDSYSPLSLILTGQSELRDTLSKQVYEAISQRVQIRYQLPSFERKGTEGYIGKHLENAGRSIELFTDAAIEAIHEYTGGIARKINNVCIAGLLYAMSQKKRVVDDHMIRHVIEMELTW
jgi:type II secretory pathway predicted ATPase ExeA